MLKCLAAFWQKVVPALLKPWADAGTSGRLMIGGQIWRGMKSEGFLGITEYITVQMQGKGHACCMKGTLLPS